MVLMMSRLYRRMLCISLLALATVVVPSRMDGGELHPHGCLEWLTEQQCAQLAGATGNRTPLVAAVTPSVSWSPQPCNSTTDFCAHSVERSTPSSIYCPEVGRYISCPIDYCEYDSCSQTNCWQDSYKTCCNNDHTTTTSSQECH
jgi:hypothetical protein